ncbi:hypothetical protein B296_00020675 [Ensete ventricosum]|uniref:Uncharacterized protein n=1 Tax=Ensete ventricosum TaxID=4639 RepID=A0A426ZJK7_ENSVE|nr:hypothetical protein B296_00020675 [Ensete ventricosum]
MQWWYREGELDYHVVGVASRGTGENEVKSDGDKDVYEEEYGSGDHCILSVELIDAYLPEEGPEALQLIVSVREAVRIRLAKQQRLDATVDSPFHDNAS